LLAPRVSLDETCLVCEHDCLHAVAEVELLEDVRDMCLDGRVVDEELVCDLCGGETAGSQSRAESGAHRGYTGRGTALIAQPPVGCDESTSAELEAAVAGAERTGVHGVVADGVEDPCHGCLRGRVIPGDRQGATVGRAGRARQQRTGAVAQREP
jgi:hypothetical protein